MKPSPMEGMKREVRWRQADRVPTRLPAVLLARTSREVTVLDLSLVGCLVRCDTLLDHGAIFDLRLQLDEKPLAVKVQVTESFVDGTGPPEGPPGFLSGLRFLALPAREEADLLRFLATERRKRRADPTAP